MASGPPILGRVHALVLAAASVCGLGVPFSCFANPTGGVVVNGDAVIQNAIPGLTTIVQSTNRAIIDWQSFSIGTGERTNFIVPDATSATLNRVLGCDPSILNGSLTSNGHVFLINSNGIVFGQGSMVDVAGLTASTLDVDNCAFMAGGDMVFRGSSEARVKNAGVIRASSGDVFLIGYQVSNSGTIQAPNGTVVLAAGSEVLIRSAGDERVVVRTATGSQKKYGVSNSGVIEANAAELKAHGGNVYALAIRNTGRVAATGVTTQGGRILLKADGGRIESTGSLVARRQSGRGGQITVSAGKQGSVDIGGRVDADGTAGAGGQIAIDGEQVTIRRAIAVSADGQTEGGQIEIGSRAEPGTDEAAAAETRIAGTISASSSQGIGGEIHLGGGTLVITDDAVISANGLTGGGRILAGGGWPLAQCGLLNSTQVVIDCGVLLEANAIQTGDGGSVVVTAGQDLVFQGSLSARGGQTSGNGGLAELSSGVTLSIDRLSGRVDLGATNGRAGTLLALSSEWEISNRCNWTTTTNVLDDEDVSNFLNSANLAVQTVLGSGGGSGNITLTGNVAWSSANALTLSADCDFLLLNSAGAGVIDALGTGAVTISAARSVLLEACTRIGTTTGDVVIQANQGASPLDGDFRGITVAGDVSSTGGNITLVGRAGASSVADTPAILVDCGTLSAGGGGILTLKTTGGIVVNQGTLSATGLVLEGNSDFILGGSSNEIGTVATNGVVGSLTLESSTALTVGKIGSAKGLSAVCDIRVSTPHVAGLVVRENITSQGGVIELGAAKITVNAATISTTGDAAVTLTGNEFLLLNQPVIKGMLVGTGGNAQLTINDSSFALGGDYLIEADKITVGSRLYSFQNIAALRLDLGSGNDRVATDFFGFTQSINAGGGRNQLFVALVQQTLSPLLKPGFGTITSTGFSNIPLDGTPFGSLLLQGVTPGGGGGGGSSSQTNNFNSTSIGGASGLAGGIGALGGAGGGFAAATGGLLANLSGSLGQSMGFVSAGGGAPPSLRTQALMNATTSAAVESELNAALGGDGTMGVRSSTGLVSVDPHAAPASAASVAQLNADMNLEALGELSFGVFGVSQVTLNSLFGAQAIHLGGTAPSGALQQRMGQVASPESFSTLSSSLGGDGVARIENAAGIIAVDLRGGAVSVNTQAGLMGILSRGALGELILALGGMAELIVNDTQGLVSIHAEGTAPGAAVALAMQSVLSASGMSQMSLMLEGDGTGVMQPEDGIQSVAFDAALPGPFVKSRLFDATSPQSFEELDHATR